MQCISLSNYWSAVVMVDPLFRDDKVMWKLYLTLVQQRYPLAAEMWIQSYTQMRRRKQKMNFLSLLSGCSEWWSCWWRIALSNICHLLTCHPRELQHMPIMNQTQSENFWKIIYLIFNINVENLEHGLMVKLPNGI